MKIDWLGWARMRTRTTVFLFVQGIYSRYTCKLRFCTTYAKVSQHHHHHQVYSPSHHNWLIDWLMMMIMMMIPHHLPLHTHTHTQPPSPLLSSYRTYSLVRITNPNPTQNQNHPDPKKKEKKSVECPRKVEKKRKENLRRWDFRSQKKNTNRHPPLHTSHLHLQTPKNPPLPLPCW